MTRTQSLKKVNNTSRALFVVILLLAFAIVFGVNSKQVNAESTYTITGQYVTENLQTWTPEFSKVPDEVTTTFSLYKVGHYENVNGKSVIVLDGVYSNVHFDGQGLDIDKKDYEGKETEWIKAWLATAQTLSMKVEGQKVVDKSQEITGNQTFVLGDKGEIDEEGKGLYLLVGTSCSFEKNGHTVWWRPQPMLIQVFDGSETTVYVKPECEALHKFCVTKSWIVPSGEQEAEGMVRPESVKVNIYYDKANNQNPVYEDVVLGPSSKPAEDWRFSWTARKGQDDPFKWTVEEQIPDGEAGKYYTYVVSELPTVDNGEISDVNKEKVFELTNTFEPAKLNITKNLKNYLNNSNNVSTTFVFEVTGYKENVVEPVYHKYVSLKFDAEGNEITGDGTLTNSKEVNYLPIGLSKLVVKEIDSSNYKVVDKKEKTYTADGSGTDGIDFDGDVYTVSFTNTHNGQTHYNGGVINHFDLDGNTFTPGQQEGKTYKDKN